MFYGQGLLGEKGKEDLEEKQTKNSGEQGWLAQIWGAYVRHNTNPNGNIMNVRYSCKRLNGAYINSPSDTWYVHDT